MDTNFFYGIDAERKRESWVALKNSIIYFPSAYLDIKMKREVLQAYFLCPMTLQRRLQFAHLVLGKDKGPKF